MTRQFIVEKTAPVFNMKGYAGTSLTDLTTATGLTKGSIYGNFANKDEVALAVFDYNLSLLNKGLAAAVGECKGSIAKLQGMTNFYRAGSKTLSTRGGCPILNTAIESDDTHPALKEKAAKGLKNWKKNIESLVEAGIKRKEIRPDINAGVFATEFIALIEGGIMISKLTNNSTMLHTCLDRIEKIIKEELTP